MPASRTAVENVEEKISFNAFNENIHLASGLGGWLVGAFVRARMAWKLLLCTSLFLNEGFSGFPPSFWVSFVRFFLFGSNSLTTSSSACSLADCVRERGARQETGAGQKAPTQCRSWKEFSRERNKGHGHHYHQWPPLQPRCSCLLLVGGFVLGDERHSTTRRREQ